MDCGSLSDTKGLDEQENFTESREGISFLKSLSDMEISSVVFPGLSFTEVNKVGVALSGKNTFFWPFQDRSAAPTGVP